MSTNAPLILYHTIRAVCPQKVRSALAEKGLDYEGRILKPGDLRSPEYLALNRNGYAPTLIHEGYVLTESRTISEYLDEAFPAPALMPATAIAKAKVRNWVKQIDDSLHLNIFILSFTASFRRSFVQLPSEVQQQRLPLNPIKRGVMQEIINDGIESTYFPMAVDRFQKLLADMEIALEDNEWLGGENYTLADTDFTPYLRRLEEIGFWQVAQDNHPCVARWFGAVRRRPSFAQAIINWETNADRAREAGERVLAQPVFGMALAE